MLFALAVLPVLALIGVSLDFNRAINTKSHIQSALDAAVLWSAVKMSQGGEANAIQVTGQQVFDDNLRTRGVVATCPRARISADPGSRKVTGTADCSVPLTLAALVTNGDLDVEAKAEAVYGGDKVEIALMIDVSGSMRGQRLTDLKAAARTLVDTLIPTSNTGDVRISMAPYGTAINAGLYSDVVTGITDLYAHTVSNLGADPDKLIAAQQVGSGEAFDMVDAVGNGGLASLPTDFFACASGGPAYTDKVWLCEPDDFNSSSDGCENEDWRYKAPASYNHTWDFPMRVCPDFRNAEDDDDDECRVFPTELSYDDVHGDSDCVDGSGSATDTSNDWRALDWSLGSAAYGDYDFSVLGASHEANIGTISCVTERAGTNAFTNLSPVAHPVGARASSCPRSAVEPLTHNKTILHDAIDGLHADGWTAGHLGIAWTWYTLSPDWSAVWPFNRRTGLGGTTPVKRYAVLMTDGSFNTYYESGQGDSDSQARSLCAAMKADGVTIFSVAFSAPAAGQAVLRDCASASSTYFEASNGAELLAVYEEIAASVSNVRLSD